MRGSRVTRLVAATAAALTATALTTISAGAHGLWNGGHSTVGLVVHTSNGAVRGATTTSYNEYLGIPYAQPPTGALRWQAPRPAMSWSGVRDATKFGNRCVQGTGWDPGYENNTLTEDCLYLNVYVPHDVKWGSQVMVWIHGGGFAGGAGQDTDPRKYIDLTHSVYVTINYRLGALGFLNLPQLRSSGAFGAGDFGLLDQQAALRWVQRNIARFGGNPHNVTIAGQSAGGSSVCDQMASPTTRGLFQKAIIMSGGCSMATRAAADTAGQTFATYLGCTNSATVLACLRGKSSADILAAQMNAGVRFGPSVGGSGTFPINPADAVKTGNFNHVPVMNGQTHDENRLFVFQVYDYTGNPVTAAQYTSIITSTYGASAPAILAAYPVSSFSSPSIALATVRSDQGSYNRYVLDTNLSKYVPTWAYEFAEEQTPQFYSIYRLQQHNAVAAAFPFGATHVDDLGYLWDYVGHTLPYSDDELELGNQMIAEWSAFQKWGTPNAPFTPIWPHFHAWSPFWMQLKACQTAESSNQPPASCAAASTSYMTDHHFALWSTVPSM